MEVRNYRDLIAWQKAHQLVKEIYRVTKGFPHEENFGLVSQLRRASVSVASNIVEGFGRRGIKESLHFYSQSHASLKEVDYQCFLSFELGYISHKDHELLESLNIETSKLLLGWIKGHRTN